MHPTVIQRGRPFLLAMLLIPVLLPPRGGAEEILLAGQALSVTGEVRRLQPGQPVQVRVDGKGQEYPFDSVVEIRFRQATGRTPGEARVELASGDRLVGSIVGGDRNRLSLLSRTLGKVDTSLLEIRRVVLRDLPHASTAPPPEEGVDVLHLAGGDRVVGALEMITPEAVLFEPRALGTTRSFPLTGVLQVALADLGSAARPPAAGRVAVISLTDGTRIRASVERLEGGDLVIHQGSQGSRRIPAGSVADVLFLEGEYRFLSDLTPVREVHTLPLPSVIAFPAQRDRAVTGGPLWIGGQLYSKGLGVHAHSEMEYETPPGMDRVVAMAGLDGTVPQSDRRASVIFRVRTGDRVLWESPVIRATDRPVPVEVELDGSPRFTLEVDLSDNLHVLDRAGWGAARVAP